MNARILAIFALTLGALSGILGGCPATTGEDIKLKESQEKERLDKVRQEMLQFVEEGRANNDKSYRKKYNRLLKEHKTYLEKEPDSTFHRYLYGFLLIPPKQKWEQFNTCLKLDPKHFWCLIGRGNIYVRWNIKDRANEDFTLAQTLRPDRMEPLIGLAEIAMLRRQDSQAIQLYQQVLSKQEGNRDALHGLAVLHQRQGHNEKAISFYARLLKYQPKHFDSLRALGDLYYKAKLMSQAADVYERALQVRSKRFRIIVRLATIYENHLKQSEKALELYERASRLPQSHFHTYYRLGVLRGQKGQLDDGISSLVQALRLQAEHPGALLALGQLYLQKQDGDKATPVLWKALRANNGSVESRSALAKALELKGDFAGVLQQYEEILKLDSNRSDIKEAMGTLLRKLGLENETFSGSSPRQVYERGKQKVYRCYKSRLKQVPNTKGNINIKLRISESGSVQRVSILLDKTTLSDKLIQACVKWTYKRALFPRLPRPRAYEISGLLEFRP